MEKSWQILPAKEKELSRIPVKDSVLRRLFYHRNLKDKSSIKKFLQPSLEDLADPLLHADMEKAVGRIKEAIEKGETIVIYGDYDADGLTGSVILYEALQHLGAKLGEIYIPDRLEEGYGLRSEVIKQIARKGTNLLITVDTGVAAREEIKKANSLGLDVIVTDHHQIGKVLPEALAVVHPHHSEGKHPYRDFSGAGMAWQLARLLAPEKAWGMLDLVALGTVADLVPLTGENRVLVSVGLAALAQTRRVGLQALLEVANLRGQKLDSYHLGYYLGPRLNAAGRVSHPRKALDLLLAEELESGRPLAEELNRLNNERQTSLEETLEKAFEMVGKEPPKIIFLADSSFSIGLAGLIAAKLRDQYFRPAIVVDSSQALCRGSARSVEGVNLVGLLNQCQNWLENFGGHSAAAGLSVHRAKLKGLAEALGKVEEEIDEKLLKPVLLAEAEVKFSELTLELVNLISYFKPFGKGNEEPVFLSRKIHLERVRPVGGNRHLQFTASDGSTVLSGIYFDGDRENFQEGGQYDLVFTVDRSNYPGRTPVEIKLVDFKLAK